MNIRLWGTRGSLPTPGSGTERYGGNTACIEVGGTDSNHVVVLDAGSGIRPLGTSLPSSVQRVDVLLSHLHMDHILGLGFFDPLFRPDMEVHIWGPSSATLGLRDRLIRYLSPPLFPVRLGELPCELVLHDVPLGTFDLPTLAGHCCPGVPSGADGRLSHRRRSLGARLPPRPRARSRRAPVPRRTTLDLGIRHRSRCRPPRPRRAVRRRRVRSSPRMGPQHDPPRRRVRRDGRRPPSPRVPPRSHPRRPAPRCRICPGELGETSFTITPAHEGATVEVGATAAVAG